jgi:hypothetical protein
VLHSAQLIYVYNVKSVSFVAKCCKSCFLFLHGDAKCIVDTVPSRFRDVTLLLRHCLVPFRSLQCTCVGEHKRGNAARRPMQSTSFASLLVYALGLIIWGGGLSQLHTVRHLWNNKRHKETKL